MENNSVNWGDSTEESQPNNQLKLNWGEGESNPEDNIPDFDWGESNKETTVDIGENWGDPDTTESDTTDLESNQVEFSTEENIISQEDLDNDHLERFFNFIGNVPSIVLNTKLWYVNAQNEQILSENIDLNNLTSLDNDSKYQLDFHPNTPLADLMVSISKTGLRSGLKLNNAFLYKLKPYESAVNVFKGNPKAHFIYFLQANYNAGEIILDLSAINGPSARLLDSTPGMLAIFDGWVPYRISKNTSDKDLIAIAGTFI